MLCLWIDSDCVCACVLVIKQRFHQIIQHAQVALHRLKPAIIAHITVIVEQSHNKIKP